MASPKALCAAMVQIQKIVFFRVLSFRRIISKIPPLQLKKMQASIHPSLLLRPSPFSNIHLSKRSNLSYSFCPMSRSRRSGARDFPRVACSASFGAASSSAFFGCLLFLHSSPPLSVPSPTHSISQLLNKISCLLSLSSPPAHPAHPYAYISPRNWLQMGKCE